MAEGILRSSEYDPGRPRVHHLSLLSGPGFSAWCTHDTATGGLRALHWSTTEDTLASAMLPVQPASVSFLVLPEWNTLVPTGALTSGAEAGYLALVHGRVPAGAMRDEPVQHLGATCIYVHDDRYEHRILDRFPNARPVAMGVLMVHLGRKLATDRSLVLMHRGVDRLDVAVHRGNDLLLCNTFPVQGAEDVLYFGLLACERTGLAAADTALYLGGTHLTGAERELVARYFGVPVPVAGLAWADVAEGAHTEPGHWLALTEQFACVS